MTDRAKAKCASPNDCQNISLGHPSFEEIVTLDNLYQAFLCARKGKRERLAINRFELNLGANLTALYDELTNGTYKPMPCTEFEIWCRSGQKTRLISAPAFRDTVVQHLIYQNLYDTIDKHLIYDSYGCRRFKGTHKAADRVQQFMRQVPSDSYYLQMDVRRYYYNIDHAILRKSLERIIKDEKLVDLMISFADNKDGIGLNVGCLLSQVFGAVYLDRFDHYVKRVLKVKHYVRFVDDTCFILPSREEAYQVKNACEQYLKDELHLTLSKWRIQKISRGINYCGFRTWTTHRFIRKRSLHNFSKQLKRHKLTSLISILGHAMTTSSYRHLLNRTLDELSVEEIRSLPKRFKEDLSSVTSVST